MNGLTPIGRQPPQASLARVTQPSAVRLETIAEAEMLHRAWRRVRSNNGQPGGDRITIAEFGAHLELEIQGLRETLLDGSYRPRRLARYSRVRPTGGIRRLAVPSIVDRLAQTAALISLGPAIDARMSDASWGYRPERGVAGALAAARQAVQRGRLWIVDADIRCFFDRVCHRRLMQDLCFWIGDERVLRLFAHWLRGFSATGSGIAQGSPISPLLANVYLHPLDRLAVAAGHEIVRYADDFLIMTHDAAQARRALGLAASLLSARGLSLNDAKTRIARADEDVRFLGEALVAAPCLPVREESP